MVAGAGSHGDRPEDSWSVSDNVSVLGLRFVYNLFSFKDSEEQLLQAGIDLWTVWSRTEDVLMTSDSHWPDSSGAFSKTNHVFEIASHVQITITSLIPKRVDGTFIWEVGSSPGGFPMETRSRMSVGG